MAGKLCVLDRAADPFRLARRMTTPVWVYDTDHDRIAFANESACRIWKAENEASLCLRDLGAGMSATVGQRLRQYQTDFIDSDAVFNEFWTIYPDDEPVTLKVVYSGFAMPDGRMAMMCEVTDTVEEEPETLRSADALLHTDVMIALYAIGGEVLYLNPAARNLMPAKPTAFEDLFEDRRDHERVHRDCGQDGATRRVVRVRTSLGPKWFDLSIKRCLDAATGDQALLVTAIDVSALKMARDEASYLADRDQLTGCYNRAFMQRVFERTACCEEPMGPGARASSVEDAGSARGCSRRPAMGTTKALLYLDIDHFKQINDTYGHAVGDAVLQVFAKRVSSAVRQSDIVARMGGDEFVVVLNDVADETILRRRLDVLRDLVSQPIHCAGVTVLATTSIGAATCDQGGQAGWAQIMQQADIALYESKRAGRNRHTLFDAALGAEAAERKWLEAALKTAVAERAFTLHLQPRLDLETGRVLSAEALLRWYHPERGPIAPDRFIPACEELGLMDELGTFVLDEACRVLSDWHAAGSDLGLSVNVSPHQFQHSNFLAIFEKIVERGAFPPERLELEITESSLVSDGAAVEEKIRRIDALGFRLALDDFGTGFSNLAHIARIPVRCIKMDKSFVQRLPASGPLLRLVLTLARQIGAETVAEGVENEAQLAWLEAEGCDQIQGFLFSKAVPEEALAQAIADIEAKVGRSRVPMVLYPLKAARASV